MNGTQTAIVTFVAVWLALATFGIALCVSQLTVLTKRFELTLGVAPATESGPAIGMDMPPEAEDLLTHDDRGELILLMSATCGPCRTVADELYSAGFDGPLTVLLPGNAESASEIAARLPASLAVVPDPHASRYAKALDIIHTPFALAVLGRTIVGKSPINSVSDLRRLQEGIDAIDLRERQRLFALEGGVT